MASQGMFAQLAYKATGVGGAGFWSEMEKARDVTLNLDAGEADVTTRGNDGWRATIAGLKEASIDFELVWEPDDPGFEAVKDAYLNGTTIGLAALDVAGAEGEGLVGDFSITNFSRAEPLEDAIIVSVTAKLAVFSEWTDTGVPFS